MNNELFKEILIKTFTVVVVITFIGAIIRIVSEVL